MSKSNLSVTINANFDSIADIITDISSLQTYKLFPDDNMLLINMDDLIEILKRHIVSKRSADNG